jgi:hypothetical protein
MIQYTDGDDPSKNSALDIDLISCKEEFDYSLVNSNKLKKNLESHEMICLPKNASHL